MNNKIFKIALPNIISNITIPLLGLVDLALMGHLGKLDFIGAIALSGMIFNLLYWSFSFLKMGTSGLTAQAYGARNLESTILNLSRSLYVAVIGSLIILILQKPIEIISFYFINADNGVEEIAKSYFYIRIWAAPASISLFAISGWFIGMQNAKSPMIIAITGNILNIIFSSIFVYYFHMQERGVALGTLIAQYISLAIAIVFLRKYYSKLFKYWSYKAMIKLSEIKKFFTVNKDIFIRTLCIIFVFTFFTSQSASTNKSILAVNSLLLQFIFIFSYFIDGFAHAAEALVGKYIGSGEKHKLKKLIKILFLWAFGLSACFSLVYKIAYIDILKALTNDISIINLAKEYILWIIFMPLASFASYIFDGIYIGATASINMRKTMLMATILIFIPTYYIFKNQIGNHALWLAMFSFMFGRGLFQAILLKKSLKQDK